MTAALWENEPGNGTLSLALPSPQDRSRSHSLIIVVYYGFALYSRASARELKQLDVILRPSLYAHFSESLTGLATIRAYSETRRFRNKSEDQMNIENRFV